MKVTIETLEVASIALNAKVSEFDSYAEGTSGYAMRSRYKAALDEVNELIEYFYENE